MTDQLDNLKRFCALRLRPEVVATWRAITFGGADREG
jgi:hypothetical protein